MIVSHRTSVLEHADVILVLAEGRVVERGTHAGLLAQGMCRIPRQRGKDDDDRDR